MKKVNEVLVLWEDSQKIKDMQIQLENLVPLVQKAVDTFLALNLPGDIPLSTILTGSEILIKNHMRRTIPETLEIPGIKVNRERAISLNLITLEGHAEFLDALQAVTTLQEAPLISYLTMDGQTVKVDEAKMNRFIQNNSVIVETPEQHLLYQKLSTFLKNLEDLNDHLEKYNIQIRRRLEIVAFDRYFMIDRDNKLKINYKTFQSLTRVRNSRIAPEPVEQNS
jgi:hypothetical protein